MLFSSLSCEASSFCTSVSVRESSIRACASATETGLPQGVWSGLCSPKARIKAIIRSWRSTSAAPHSIEAGVRLLATYASFRFDSTTI